MRKVDVWADVRCPWCWIGLWRLGDAVRQTNRLVSGGITVRHRSFLLEPDGPATPGRPLAEVAVRDWGMAPEQWRAKSEAIRAAGELEGLEIHPGSALTFDSRPVHRLLKAATTMGDTPPALLWEAAFDAHFRRNADLSRRSGLLALARELSFSSGVAHQLLAGSDFSDEVTADLELGRLSRITSVPTVLVDGRRLAGNTPTRELARALRDVEAVR